MSVDVHINEPRQSPSVMALPSIPPLENGDYLTRDEFERRYNAMPADVKAELIEGRVYMTSPVRYKSHGAPNRNLNTWLGVYSAFTPGVSGAKNTTVLLDQPNEPQPDGLLIIDELLGGQTTVSADDYLEGAPELVVEVSASSASLDLREKLSVYRRNGVREYIVWSVFDQQFKWFSLEAGEYVELNPDEDGVIRSRVFPGLWLDVDALLKDNMAKVLAILQQGLASPEHTDFIEQLSKGKR
ncbi:MAG: Uma2 family endonuclease [Blastocatellales bacterium]